MEVSEINTFIKKFTHDFSYSFLLNIINLVVKSIFVLILPKLIGVSDFGYWQLYFLYTFFIPFFHLGLVDGVYLQKGGLYYKHLDFTELREQFFILICLGVIWSLGILSYSSFYVDNINKVFIFTVIALDIILTLPRTLISVIFQMTGMIKQYSLSLMSESISSFILIMTMILLDIRDFKTLILADCIARGISLLVSLLNAKEFIGYLPRLNKSVVNKSIEYIKIGVFILLSNMAGLIVIAAVRFFIELRWDIILFSKVSLAFSIASIVVTATSAAGIVLFPLLKRVKSNLIEHSFSSLSLVLGTLILIIQAIYYPAILVLQYWLPKYTDSIYFLAIILPMTFFDTQFTVIGSNFLKVLREEQMLLWINCLAILVTFIIIAIAMFFSLSFEYVLYGLLIQSVIKVLLTTSVLKKQFHEIRLDFLVLIIFTTILFVISNIVVKGFEGFISYILGMFILIFCYKYKIINAIQFLRRN